jgi:hypothetical protein
MRIQYTHDWGVTTSIVAVRLPFEPCEYYKHLEDVYVGLPILTSL